MSRVGIRSSEYAFRDMMFIHDFGGGSIFLFPLDEGAKEI
jgi:hypothetical protein